MNIKFFNFFNKSKYYYSIDKLDLALSYINKAMEYCNTLDEKIEGLYVQGLILDELDEDDKALEKFEMIYGYDNNQCAAVYAIAMIKEKLGLDKEAEDLYKKCIAINPKYDRAYFFLANLLDNNKRYEEALFFYKKTLELVRDDYMVYNNMGAIYENLDQLEKAEEMLDKSIKIKPDYFRPYFNKGVVYGRLKEYDKAVRLYEKSIELNSKYGYNYLNLSALYIERKMFSKSLEILNRGLKEADDILSDLYYNRACVYAIIGMKNSALKSLKKAVRIDLNLIKYAIKDEDFAGFYDDKEFKRIVGDKDDIFKNSKRDRGDEKGRRNTL